MEWTNDPQIESLLTEMGVKYHVEDAILTTKLMLAESLKNNARLDMPLDDDIVIDYGVNMTAPNAKFPRLVVHARPAGRYFILSGNHRAAACDTAGIKTVSAYVVDTADQLVLDDICRRANRLHGKRQDSKEALRHASQQMDQYNLSISTVAAKFGVDQKRLSNFRRVEKVRVRLQLGGIQAAALFTPTVLTELAKIQNDTVIREAARVVGRRELSAADTAKLVELIREQPAVEADQLAVIGHFDAQTAAKRREIEPHGAKARPLKTQFTVKLRQLLTFLKKRNATTLAQLQITGVAEQKEVAADLAELVAYVLQLQGEGTFSVGRNTKK